MDAAKPTAIARSSRISFGDVILDIDNFELQRAGEQVPIEPQVFDVLCYLVEHRDRVVSKEELFDNVWGDRFVSESALTSRIKSARQAVGDDGRRQEIIRTTHGRGYRFVAEVDQTVDPDITLHEPVIDLGERDGAELALQRNRVPAPPRPLVARDDELSALVDLLSTNRLVTVVGPGGVGKTRLAIEVARRWDEERDDAVTFVALAAISDPDDVSVAIRDALGIGRGGSVDAFGVVREALSGKSALLVLDNFEHVVDAATVLADLVELVPGVRLLVTSRERLGLAGEHVLELGPFSLTDDGSNVGSAVTFFEHAVRGVRSDLDLDATNRDDIMAICRTLDALPLAIELAAAQTRYFSLSYLRSHLESAAITVADHARDRPERHHTMQSTIAWSYRLLTPSQQGLLASLSVFRGSWPFEVAGAMSGSEDGGEAAPDLLALVDKSLVQRSDGVFGEPRFSMLHLLRDFAGSELDASGGREEALGRHAAFVGESVRALEARRWGDSGDGWIDAIGVDYADAVAALTWCFGGGDRRIGCEIVGALGYWWYRTGRLGDGRVWVGRALDNIDAADESATAWIHSAAGTLAAYEHRHEESCQHFETALITARQNGDERLEALSLCQLAEVASETSEERVGALDSVKRGLDQARRLGSPPLIVHALTTIGELMRANGNPDEAEAAYREALELDAQLGDRHYEALNTVNLGHAVMAQGRVEEAPTYYARGIELAAAIGGRLMMAWSLSGLATAHHLLGQPKLAARVTGAAEATLDALGTTHGPIDQPVHDRRQEVLRKDLGSSEYDRLIAEGRAMTLEEGIEIAITALDRESA